MQKIVRLHRFFLHQISLESKLNGRQKVKGGNGSISASISTSLIASLICLAHCLAHHPEPRSGLCPELLADFRIPKPPGCSQGAQRAVFCAVRVADFLAEGAGWGASPGRGGELGCQRRGAEGSVLCSLITDFLAEGAGWGASPGPGGELGCEARA